MRKDSPGDAIAGVSLIKRGDNVWHDAPWVRLINPVVGKLYTLNVTGLRLDSYLNIKPIITEVGTYDGLCAAWNGFNGTPTALWILKSGKLSDGTQYYVYKPGMATLVDRQNEISKDGELVVRTEPVKNLVGYNIKVKNTLSTRDLAVGLSIYDYDNDKWVTPDLPWFVIKDAEINKEFNIEFRNILELPAGNYHLFSTAWRYFDTKDANQVYQEVVDGNIVTYYTGGLLKEPRLDEVGKDFTLT